MPTPINPPSGCRFHTRCRYKMDICEKEDPAFKDIGGEHFVACHLMDLPREKQPVPVAIITSHQAAVDLVTAKSQGSEDTKANGKGHSFFLRVFLSFLSFLRVFLAFVSLQF